MENKINRIKALIQANKLLESKKIIEEELKAHRNSNELLFLLGEVNLSLQYLEEAETTFLRLKEINSKDENVYIGLGKVNYEKSYYENALIMADNALNINNKKYEALTLKYEIMKKLKYSNSERIQFLKTILSINSTPEYSVELSKTYMEEENYDEAIKTLKTLLVRYPNHELAGEIRRLYSIASKRPKTLENKEEGSAIDELNSFIGLEDVKHQVEKLIKQIQFDKQRKVNFGLTGANTQGFHFVFTGNPGTGKTTIARIIGNILKESELLEKGNVVEVDRSDLVGEYIGSTAQLTKKKIKEAMGGILFIDEAYALYKDPKDNRDFGREAVDTLIKAMEDDKGKFTIIMAGYKKEMDILLESNPGLKSRVNIYIDFPDYRDSELLLIGQKMASERNFKISETGQEALIDRLSRKRINEQFGNAREVRNLIEEAIQNKAYRLAGKNFTREEASYLDPVDFGVESHEAREDKIEDVFKELDILIGLDKVKLEISNIRNYIEYQQKRQDMGFKTNDLSLHMMFVGNPGTGKTTVARIVGKIFKELGILKKGHFIEATKEDLIGEYVGQTAIKTKDVIKKAYGGVLFIDEAYALAQGGENDFGKEAIAVLIKEMEDNRDKLVVIFAGYDKEMKELMDTNSGLVSRIKNKVHFEDYDPDQLYNIFLLYCSEEEYILSPETEPVLKELFKEIHEKRSHKFGNGRDVRNVFEDIKIQLAIRANSTNINSELINVITKDDVTKYINKFR